MCPNCDTFYCIKCAQTLSNMENLCWFCNEPIDESKPTKPFKVGENEIELDISKTPKNTPKKF